MQTVFSIPGIHCKACETLIKDVTSSFPSVQHVSVNLDTKEVTLDYGDDFDVSAWTREVETLGDAYKVHQK